MRSHKSCLNQLRSYEEVDSDPRCDKVRSLSINT